MKISRRIPPGTPSSHARKYLPIAFSLIGEMSVRAERAFRSWPACKLRRAPQLRADERVFQPVYAYMAASHVPASCTLPLARFQGCLPFKQINGADRSPPRGETQAAGLPGSVRSRSGGAHARRPWREGECSPGKSRVINAIAERRPRLTLQLLRVRRAGAVAASARPAGRACMTAHRGSASLRSGDRCVDRHSRN